MPEVQIGRCGIKPCLDSEWAIESELVLQLTLGQKFAASAPDKFQLFWNRPLHRNAQCLLAVIICRKAPIDQLIEHRIDIIRAPVLIIEVICMFPDIDRQEGTHAFRQR